MAAEAPPQIQYRDLMAECQQLMSKIASIEGDRNEHVLVEETLQPLDAGRRAYRLVGDVLVERTVAEVLPSITQNKDNLNATIQALGDRLSIRQKKAAELKSKHNLDQ
ncbi:Prefoldin beta-like protein [Fragilariopsis cylindrus CCMP1102]|uniref:Prefoldin beta-like protein n=1 Tax=Fragilariopsis cylindrus CCMP1102 TaxID=635003 RepID=A0A1E7F6E4_9STRA|nr:Prefoldin beta-like protein [Fragilariopsis cylindrus CCMP1102]|eukprot:OEU13684.1 Prefoldin beta-like protein [Fragilariopsis cylindrus CCMP1102]